MQVVEYYTKNGITAIELGSSHKFYPTDNPNHLTNFHECQYLIHNYFPPSFQSFVFNLSSNNSEIRKQSVDLAKRAVDLCVMLNVPFYSCHAGFITDPYAFGTTSYLFEMPKSTHEVELAIDFFVESLYDVGNYAQERNIRLLIENNVCTETLKGKLLLQTAEEFVALFTTLRSNNIGILLDFGHLNVTAHTFGFDKFAFVDAIAQWVEAVHIHDNNGLIDEHKPLELDSWIVDVLRRPDFMPTVKVIESRFQNVELLKNYLESLSKFIGYRMESL
jgi:sugar phosphate isomerase/epimerase